MTWLLAAALLAVAVAGDQAPVVNAKVERRAAPASIAREVQTVAERGAAAWIGYRVPMATRQTTALRSEWCCGRCRLEPPTELLVLARVEGGRLIDLRPIAVDCDIDAAGMPLVWLDGVNADDSVRWLEGLATADATTPRTRIAKSALSALSQHAAPLAVTRLMALAQKAPHPDIQRDAFQLLGGSNDPRAIAFLSDILLK